MQLDLFPTTPRADLPLPLVVAHRWNFPLAYDIIDEVYYYAAQDWVAGLTTSTIRNAQENVRKYKRTADLKSAVERPYLSGNDKTYHIPFCTDNDLYLLAQWLRVTKTRPALKEIQEYLAKAGAFADDLRRNPENAAATLLGSVQAKAERLGHTAGWAETRTNGIITRKQFTDAIKDALANPTPREYAGLTATVYDTVFGQPLQALRDQLGISKHANIRDHIATEGLTLVMLAEAASTRRLTSLAPHPNDTITYEEAQSAVLHVCDAVRSAAVTLGLGLGYDMITGLPLVTEGVTPTGYTTINERNDE